MKTAPAATSRVATTASSSTLVPGPAIARRATDTDAAWTRLGTRVLFGIALLLLLAGSLGRSISRPLWHDELFTYYLAGLPGTVDIWKALAAATDLNPPLYHLSVHLADALLGPGPLATRLPALVGFLGATIALFVFVRQRLPEVFALIAALVPSLTTFHVYATEGRPYGLVLGLSAIALVAWQARGKPGSHRLWPLICGAVIAAATATHYYGVFIVVPLAVGELTRIATRRRIDWPMILALSAPLPTLVLLRPLMNAARGFGATFWSPPSPGDLVVFYKHLLDPLAVLLLAAAILTAAWIVVRSIRGAGHTPIEGAMDSPSLAIEDLAVAVALLTVPIVGYGVSALVTGAFHERYVLHGVLGLAILIAWGASKLVRSTGGIAILVAVLFTAFAARHAIDATGLLRGPANPLSDQERLLALAASNSPIVVSHAVPYLQVAHYSNPHRGSRDAGRSFAYVSKPADVVEKTGDTGSRAMRLLSRITPLDVNEYDTFVGRYTQFDVYGPRSWMIPKLLSQGADVRLLGEHGDVFLYRVTMTR
jgi:hypothetical protein